MAKENLGNDLESYFHLVVAGGPPLSIPKSWVPSLGEGWVKQESWQAVPVEGSQANYRHGTYHVHEMEDHFELHEDFFDPKEHAVRHLFADTQGMMAKMIITANVSINLFLIMRLRKRSKMRDGRCIRRYVLMKSVLDLVSFLLIAYIIWVRIIRSNGKRPSNEVSERIFEIGRSMLFAGLREGLPELEEMVREMNGTSRWESTGLSILADVLREIDWEIGRWLGDQRPMAG
ncbi:MAG: hypothetical protein A4E32_01572 [Methanomassiliicoccales archaeon PtaU1.Bin124]|nr:MAG: hypothetical protein A4E32_01572 [Methanomassiliicoccales archaeon PtaU1.Bin124]